MNAIAASCNRRLYEPESEELRAIKSLRQSIRALSVRLSAIERAVCVSPVKTDPEKYRFDEVLQAVSEKHAVSEPDILGKSRRREIVHARWEVMAILHGMGWGFSRIARMFGIDHTTVMHGIKSHEAMK